MLERFVERHLADGSRLSPEELCGERVELLEPVRALIREYLDLDAAFEPEERAPFPQLEGFQTVERLGGGGHGEVYKLRDLRLGRGVAAKVLKDGSLSESLRRFLAEARTMALFSDRRVVRLFELRLEPRPVLLMELVEGFELGEVGPSLDPAQLARVFLELCEVLQHAHELGIQHRDLKPSNVMLDRTLAPKVLDFGLSQGDPRAGLFEGTPAYMAPEQLDPDGTIDARTDVHALGVMLYELLTGAPPDLDAPRLPAELRPSTPAPLAAIALKAMERDQADRYASAREMALDLRRYLDRRPVLARPRLFGSALARKLRAHVDELDEWARLQLVHPHEARELKAAYRRLERRDDDWIVESRRLTYSQIALYLGAVLALAGSLLYFGADRFYDAVKGLLQPALVLGLPVAGLGLAARALHRGGRRGVAVAYDLGAVLMLPLLLLILFHEAGLFSVVGPSGQLFQGDAVSNRQLQLALAVPCVLSFWLALRTGTVALSSAFTALAVLFGAALLSDFGLRAWLVDGRWDLLALHLLPLAVALGGLGFWLERRRLTWLCRPLYVGSAGLLVAALELEALQGRALQALGISMSRLHAGPVQDPKLLDTLTAMTAIGVLLYALAALVERHGTEQMAVVSWMLFAVSPFATLEPLFAMTETGWYSRRLDWLYLALALSVTILSHHRQRKTFYYAGLLNTCSALWLITSHRHWFDRPLWAIAVVAAGVLLLVAGLLLDARERQTRATT